MKRFIFESDIPSWASPSILQDRLNRWVAAGLDTVMLQVDDGHGATWGTTAWGLDARVSQSALRDAVAAIHDRGLSVVACVSLAAFNPVFSHHPEWVLGQFQFTFYDFWNAGFRAARLNMLKDLVDGYDIDAVALDYLRTGREAVVGQPPAASVLAEWLQSVRTELSAAIPILSVHHSSYTSGVKEGVNLTAWGDAGVIDGSVLFNYSPSFPAAHVLDLRVASRLEVWALIGNYDWTNNSAVVRSGLAVSRCWRRAVRECAPDALGVYLANLFTAEQAIAIRYTQLMLGAA